MEKNEELKFENLLRELFTAFNVAVETTSSLEDQGVDFYLQNKEFGGIYCELKFYRSKNVSYSTILKAAQYLSYNLSFLQAKSGLLIISSYLAIKQRTQIKDITGITVWDRSVLYNILRADIPDSLLLEQFEKLLLDARLGTDTESVFQEVELENKLAYNYFEELNYIFHFGRINFPARNGKQLCDELHAIRAGKFGWPAFESKCEEILKYLFENDLNVWNRQARTDDLLSRFDLICRINSKDEFWKTLVQSFNSKYVLFEFKNYQKAIGQDQIYSTERYLFTKALRSVGFIIARMGGSQQATKAAKGALREHGKLLLILDRNDLCKMLEMKDNFEQPSEYLSEKLDEFLISLSR